MGQAASFRAPYSSLEFLHLTRWEFIPAPTRQLATLGHRGVQ